MKTFSKFLEESTVTPTFKGKKGSPEYDSVHRDVTAAAKLINTHHRSIGWSKVEVTEEPHEDGINHTIRLIKK